MENLIITTIGLIIITCLVIYVYHTYNEISKKNQIITNHLTNVLKPQVEQAETSHDISVIFDVLKQYMDDNSKIMNLTHKLMYIILIDTCLIKNETIIQKTRNNESIEKTNTVLTINEKNKIISDYLNVNTVFSYNTDWNLIMSVVNKINEEHNNSNEFRDKLYTINNLLNGGYISTEKLPKITMTLENLYSRIVYYIQHKTHA